MYKRRNLNLSVETSKSRLDLGLSPSEVTLDSLLLYNEDLEQEYKSLDLAFHNDIVTHRRQIILNEISHQITQKLSWDYYKTLKLIIEISNFFHMNLVEVVYWGNLLKSVNNQVSTLILTFYITAYQAKLDLNRDISAYEYLISQKIPNFLLLFYNWTIMKGIEPTTQDVIMELDQMSKRKRFCIDYNKLVESFVNPCKKSKQEVKEVFEEETFKSFDFLTGLALSPIDKL